MIPQFIYLGLLFIALGIHLTKHGESTTINFWWSLFGFILQIILLTWGGFFKVFG